jgi:hypothetical protein
MVVFVAAVVVVFMDVNPGANAVKAVVSMGNGFDGEVKIAQL